MKLTKKILRIMSIWRYSHAAIVLSVIGAIISIALGDVLFAIAFLVSALNLSN